MEATRPCSVLMGRSPRGENYSIFLPLTVDIDDAQLSEEGVGLQSSVPEQVYA